jgi:hypothetical protein
MQTLTTLILAYNPLGALGTKYLADALETNSVTSLFIHISHNYLYSLIEQTLTTIDLRANKIGPEGVKYLSDALQKNTVIFILYSSLLIPSLIYS